MGNEASHLGPTRATLAQRRSIARYPHDHEHAPFSSSDDEEDYRGKRRRPAITYPSSHGYDSTSSLPEQQTRKKPKKRYHATIYATTNAIPTSQNNMKWSDFALSFGKALWAEAVAACAPPQQAAAMRQLDTQNQKLEAMAKVLQQPHSLVESMNLWRLQPRPRRCPSKRKRQLAKVLQQDVPACPCCQTRDMLRHQRSCPLYCSHQSNSPVHGNGMVGRDESDQDSSTEDSTKGGSWLQLPADPTPPLSESPIPQELPTISTTTSLYKATAPALCRLLEPWYSPSTSTQTNNHLSSNERWYSNLGKLLLKQNQEVNKNTIIPLLVQRFEAPVPIVIVALVLISLCPHNLLEGNSSKEEQTRWEWYRSNFASSDGESDKNDANKLGMLLCPSLIEISSSRTHAHYSALAGCSLFVARWDLMVISTSSSTTKTNTNNKLHCPYCGDCNLQYYGFEKLIPVVGDLGQKLTWVLSFLYQCHCCQQYSSGTDPDFLATLPASLRQTYPSPWQWIDPDCHFQVTQSLAQRIDSTMQHCLYPKKGAKTVASALRTQYQGLYELEASEFHLTQAKFINSRTSQFPTFAEWFGPEDLLDATDIRDLWSFARGGE